eukprot:14583-Heterococcus_DN1.PRE.1
MMCSNTQLLLLLLLLQRACVCWRCEACSRGPPLSPTIVYCVQNWLYMNVPLLRCNALLLSLLRHPVKLVHRRSKGIAVA